MEDLFHVRRQFGHQGFVAVIVTHVCYQNGPERHRLQNCHPWNRRNLQLKTIVKMKAFTN